MKVSKKMVLFIGFLLLIGIVFALDNSTYNDTNVTVGVGINVSIHNDNSSDNTSSNFSVLNPNSQVIIGNFIPKQFKVGDVQFNIQVINNQNQTLTSVAALVSGDGYSTYDVYPIDSLGPGQKDYVFVNGNFKQAGNLTLTIRIGSDVFYQNVSILGDQSVDDALAAANQRKDILSNLSSQLKDLEQKYNDLEDELTNKTADDYDVSSVSLNDLKTFIRNTQSAIITEDIGQAKSNLDLALTEYGDQKNNLDRVTKIPLIQRTKDYAVVFSAIAGALIMLFTLSELLKRKGESIVSVIGVKTKKKKKKN